MNLPVCKGGQIQSGRTDLNCRPLAPKASALAKLSHAPFFKLFLVGKTVPPSIYSSAVPYPWQLLLRTGHALFFKLFLVGKTVPPSIYSSAVPYPWQALFTEKPRLIFQAISCRPPPRGDRAYCNLKLYQLPCCFSIYFSSSFLAFFRAR